MTRKLHFSVIPGCAAPTHLYKAPRGHTRCSTNCAYLQNATKIIQIEIVQLQQKPNISHRLKMQCKTPTGPYLVRTHKDRWGLDPKRRGFFLLFCARRRIYLFRMCDFFSLAACTGKKEKAHKRNTRPLRLKNSMEPHANPYFQISFDEEHHLAASGTTKIISC